LNTTCARTLHLGERIEDIQEWAAIVRSSILDWQNMDGFNHQRHFVADFEIEIFY